MNKIKRVCKVEGCNGKYVAFGYCDKHYRKYKLYGDPLFCKRKKSHIICIVKGCEIESIALELCRKHYTRFKRHGDPLLGISTSEKHGMTNNPEYIVWGDIKQRCLNPNNEHYKDYGGRGIKICNRWLHSFVNFYGDMGPRPFPKAQIDRRENDGDYEKDNCRWVTATVNARNRRDNCLTLEKARGIRKIYKKENISLVELGLIYNTSSTTIYGVVSGKTWKESS